MTRKQRSVLAELALEMETDVAACRFQRSKGTEHSPCDMWEFIDGYSAALRAVLVPEPPAHNAMTDDEATQILAEAGIDPDAAYDRLQKLIPELTPRSELPGGHVGPALSTPAPMPGAKCEACLGHGWYPYQSEPSSQPEQRQCESCHGTGQSPAKGAL